MNSKRIFITGGASGLGRALAERYARAGWSVCIGDIHEGRSRETLAFLETLGHRMQALSCDVTQEADLQAAADWLLQNWGGVDVVVNNAGVAGGGHFTHIPVADWQWIFDINVLGVVRGCRVFTPLFQKQGWGQFINIASAAGLVHLPWMSAYNASKAAVVALSETLRFELAAASIQVSVVCPTFIRTNLTENARINDSSIATLSHRMVREAKFEAAPIADAIYRDAASHVFLILPNGEAKAAFLMKRLLPFRMYAGLIMLKFRNILQSFGPNKAALEPGLEAGRG